jgi:hypothetical protein
MKNFAAGLIVGAARSWPSQTDIASRLFEEGPVRLDQI